MAFQNPVILLPGFTGTSLNDEYPVDPEPLWTAVLKQEYERIALHPDDLRFEAREPARVARGQLFEIVYGDLIAALRHDLSIRADEPTPVFPFPYDWRQPVQATARLLEAFVDEVIARTSLLRHYKNWPEKKRKVDLVAHSFGGLVICDYLVHCQEAGEAPRVRKVASLGTPHQGSIEAIVKLVTGLASLGGEAPSAREREAARTTPAIYEFLPTYEGAAQGAPDGGLLSAESWQQGVIESLGEYIRLRAVDPPATRSAQRTRGRQLLQKLLDQASDLRRRATTLDPHGLGLAADAWLTVVGIDAATRTRIGWKSTSEGPRFELRDRVNDVSAGETGDGTVPLAGARPPFLPAESIVAVQPSDFELLEWKDRALLQLAGFHAQLPNLNLAQRLVLRHLRDDYRGSIWGRPIPGVAKNRWQPAIPRRSPAVPNGIRLESRGD
jgi:pimeloyl-ACP methyl ester carboxylesterase